MVELSLGQVHGNRPKEEVFKEIEFLLSQVQKDKKKTAKLGKPFEYLKHNVSFPYVIWLLSLNKFLLILVWGIEVAVWLFNKKLFNFTVYHTIIAAPALPLS